MRAFFFVSLLVISVAHAAVPQEEPRPKTWTEITKVEFDAFKKKLLDDRDAQAALDGEEFVDSVRALKLLTSVGARYSLTLQCVEEETGVAEDTGPAVYRKFTVVLAVREQDKKLRFQLRESSERFTENALWQTFSNADGTPEPQERRWHELEFVDGRTTNRGFSLRSKDAKRGVQLVPVGAKGDLAVYLESSRWPVVNGKPTIRSMSLFCR